VIDKPLLRRIHVRLFQEWQWAANHGTAQDMLALGDAMFVVDALYLDEPVPWRFAAATSHESLNT